MHIKWPKNKKQIHYYLSEYFDLLLVVDELDSEKKKTHLYLNR